MFFLRDGIKTREQHNCMFTKHLKGRGKWKIQLLGFIRYFSLFQIHLKFISNKYFVSLGKCDWKWKVKKIYWSITGFKLSWTFWNSRSKTVSNNSEYQVICDELVLSISKLCYVNELLLKEKLQKSISVSVKLLNYLKSCRALSIPPWWQQLYKKVYILHEHLVSTWWNIKKTLNFQTFSLMEEIKCIWSDNTLVLIWLTNDNEDNRLSVSSLTIIKSGHKRGLNSINHHYR